MEDSFEQELENYCQKLLSKFKKGPLYDLKLEFGNMLMLQYEDFTEEQLVRYNELIELLK